MHGVSKMLIYVLLLIVAVGAISVTQIRFAAKQDHKIRRDVTHLHVRKKEEDMFSKPISAEIVLSETVISETVNKTDIRHLPLEPSETAVTKVAEPAVEKLPVYFILDTSNSIRKKHVEKMTRLLNNFDVRLWSAVPADTVEDKQYSEFTNLETFSKVRRGAVGCALAHITLLEHITEYDASAVVLESDAELSSTFEKNFFEFVDNLPSDFEFGQLFHHPSMKNKRRRAKFVNSYVLESYAPYGTVGYYITRIGAKKVLPTLKPIWYPIDEMFRKAIDTRKFVSYMPVKDLVTMPYKHESTIWNTKIEGQEKRVVTKSNVAQKIPCDLFPNRWKDHGDEMIQILKVFHAMLEKLNIEYSLIGGSLLAYARKETQPMPWDDDIDIFIMPDKAADVKAAIDASAKYCHASLWLGFKMFLCDSPRIGKYAWRYPMIDIFTTSKYVDLASYIFPSQLSTFANIQVRVPKDTSYCVKHQYGKNGIETCKSSAWNHKTEKSFSKPVSFPCKDVMEQCYSERHTKQDQVVSETVDEYNTLLFGKKVNYRLPKLDWEGYVYGVLSGGPNSVFKRQKVRETWCSDVNCLFVVAGAYADVQSEFETHKDVLWLNMPETYFGDDSVLPYKTGVFYDAVKHMKNIEKVVKTDDDSYINTRKLQEVLEGYDYWGFIHKKVSPIRDSSSKWYVSKKLYPEALYPPYASGAGYALSKTFLECAQKEIKFLPFMPREDVMTGLLAKRCGVTPHHSNLLDYSGGSNSKGKLIYHYVKDMTTKQNKIKPIRSVEFGRVEKISPDDGLHYMYGYYDKRQVDLSNAKILMLQIPFYNREPSEDMAQVGWVDETRKFYSIGVTSAWNLQQGAMLEWIDKNHVVFNTRDEETPTNFKAVVYTTTDFQGWSLEKVYNKPVYAWDYKNNRFASISFARLHNLRRGYGYTVPLGSLEKCPADDGIWIVNTYERLLFSFQDLKTFVQNLGDTDKFTKLKYADKVPHGKYWWVNHLMWSSDGRYLSFILRATDTLHGHSYQFSTLMMAEVDTQTLWRVPVLRGSHPFHFDTLLNCEGKGSFSIVFQKSVTQLPWQKGMDGHCSKNPIRDAYLTDTYPHPKKSLLVFESNQKQNLGEFLPDGEGPVFTRCDLHPRWSTNGDFVLFDSTHSGKRAIYKVYPKLSGAVVPKAITKVSDRSQECSHILVDWGANIGMHSRFIFESDKYPARVGSQLEKMYAIFDKKLGTVQERRLKTCVFGVEANEKRCPRLSELEDVHKKAGWNTHYDCPFAVWSVESELGFKDQDGIGHGTASRLETGGEIKVKTINAVQYLQGLLQKYSPETVVVKMDIEGAEYTVLPELEKNGLLCSDKISDMTLEYHSRFTGHASDWQIPNTFSCTRTKIHLIDSEDYVKDGKPYTKY